MGCGYWRVTLIAESFFGMYRLLLSPLFWFAHIFAARQGYLGLVRHGQRRYAGPGGVHSGDAFVRSDQGGGPITRSASPEYYTAFEGVLSLLRNFEVL